MTSRSRTSKADLRREMYAGGRPNEAARAIHRRFVAGPLPRLLPIAAVLEVRGRNSGQRIRLPVATIRYRGSWYVVSMLGERANWVRNVRAAHGEAVLTHGTKRAVTLVEVPAEHRAPIIKRYLAFALGARPHIPTSWRAPIGAFEAIAASYPVFRISKSR